MEEDVQKALNRAYFFLKFRSRTKKEIVDYLHKKSEKFYHWSPEVMAKAVEVLEAQGFINDAAFVELYVRNRLTLKPKGEFVLRQELTKLGIDKTTLDHYFEENPLSEVELAFTVAKARWQRYRSMDKRTRFEKAVQFLTRRGFSFSTAKEVIRKMEENN